MLLIFWRAGRPNATKSWGRYWSGGDSTRCLFSTGSNDDDMFSLSSDEYELEKGSLENEGVVGVRGISSDMSETEVEQLIGVLTVDAEVRLGVTGRDGSV